MWNPFRTNQRLKDLQSEVDCLRDLLHKHSTMVAHELYKLKTPGIQRVASTLDIPLSAEQEKIVKEFFENSKLPEQIRRNFASGGCVGMRAALGRFGEAPSEQTRSTDAVHPVEPGNVNVQVTILGDTELDDLIREDNAQRDQEAWENRELLEYLAQHKE